MLRLVICPAGIPTPCTPLWWLVCKICPPALMRSITTEMARRLATADKLGAPVYFCDPRSSLATGYE
jgi:IS30 family transposase